jgi:hypothetical protein
VTGVLERPLTLGRIRASLRHRTLRVPQRAVQSGLPPAWFGWRWVREETVPAYFARGGAGRLDTIHPEARAANPLPRNISGPDELPDDPDWFGFSLRDVPTRVSGPTLRATLPDCIVVSFRDAERGEFWPAIVNRDRRALRLREITFRRGHGEALRWGRAPARVAKAIWIIERVYENHSHWLTAHLPKLCLLHARGELDDLILPARRNPVIDASLRMLGLDPGAFRTHDPDRPLRVGELTILGTDRFRPELLQPVRDALAVPPHRAPWRRVFISRARSRIRRLANETDLEPILAAAGFDVVLMEQLSFEEQVRLMSETAILMAPHGAGLTNMMFCHPGAQVIEIADISYPNPNFYALACAMGLSYWLVRGEFTGGEELHRLDRDLAVDPRSVRRVLRQIGV